MTDDYICQMIERVATIEATVTNVSTGGSATTAFPYHPADPSWTECPFWVNEHGGGKTKIAAVSGMQQLEDTVSMILCYAPFQSDINAQVLEKSTLQWVQNTMSTFAAHVQLGNDLFFVHDAFIQKWEPVVYEIGTGQYSALRFQLLVTLLYPQVVAG